MIMTTCEMKLFALSGSIKDFRIRRLLGKKKLKPSLAIVWNTPRFLEGASFTYQRPLYTMITTNANTD